ncbi:DNA-directed RNA polymerase III subunit RPC4-like [Tribolium madens]|uniref:DNA-directed RNA polymerase III subunit RPC4-like n=1 Tax=Tribolium madens TaxID=41895 RepID=UPI001CF72345|nr:DNA-directed RNA polymerase III subunit RPC4-like [Tribolium madens]
MDEKKFLKNVSDKEVPGGRLQSLKLPRDLSLGIAKPKKQYTPNLNVVRNKDKTKEFLKKMDQKRKDRTGHKVRHDKQDHKPKFVQSTGVFSQGTGEIKRLTPHNSEPRVSFRNSSTVSNLVLPTINRNSWTVNKKAEEAVLDELANCDIDSDEEKMSFKPLTLSLDSVRKVKKEVNVKKEEDLEFVPEPFNSDYSEESPALALVKLPDSFAGKGLSDDPNVKKLFDYTLKDMLEGQIGKLVIRKSGKMEVHIGRIKYELSPESTFESKEELATITEGPNGENCIAILGNVLNNFIMFPDFESLLSKK